MSEFSENARRELRRIADTLGATEADVLQAARDVRCNLGETDDIEAKVLEIMRHLAA